jgi:hypothetical protein
MRQTAHLFTEQGSGVNALVTGLVCALCEQPAGNTLTETTMRSGTTMRFAREPQLQRGVRGIKSGFVVCLTLSEEREE